MNKISMAGIFALMAAAAACTHSTGSSSTGSTGSNSNGAGDNGGTGEVDGSVSTSSSSGSVSSDGGSNVPTAPTNQAQCIAACEKQYPTAAALNKQLDNSCFTGGACEPVCDNLGTSGKLYTPSLGDGGVAACDLSNSWSLSTPSEQCSTCIATNKTCCDLWVKIYGDTTQGQPLSTCSEACYTQFRN